MQSRICNSAANGARPDKRQDLVEWAAENFRLPTETAHESGKYRIERTPWIREILQELSAQSRTRQVVVMKGTQLGATTASLIFLIGAIDLNPSASMLMMPTELMARSFSKKRFSPAVRLIPRLRDVVKDAGQGLKNTILTKEFPGGNLLLTGSNSGRSFRSESIRFLCLDDLDGFQESIADEGSPTELAARRTSSFPNAKIYLNSTPKIKGASMIEREYEQSSQAEYQVPCPHCGFFQALEFGGVDYDFGIKFTRDDGGQITDIWYQCQCCKQRIDESEKPWMLENGYYHHAHPEREIKGFHFNALLAPTGFSTDWKYIADTFLQATAEMKKGNLEKMVTWVTTLMGKPFERKSDRKIEDLKRLRDDRPDGLCPSTGVLALICGADVQDSGLYFTVRAFGRSLESWLVHFGFVDSFDALETILFESRFNDATGQEYGISACLIDSGGHRTAETYDYCGGRPGLYPTKGERTMTAPFAFSNVDNYPGSNKPLPGGVRLLRVNTTYYKNYLANKMQVSPGDPGAYYLHADTTDDYLNQMTAEYIDKSGWWTCPSGRDNHYWDTEVLALCGAELLRVKFLNKPLGITAAPGQTPTQPQPRRRRPRTPPKIRKW